MDTSSHIRILRAYLEGLSLDDGSPLKLLGWERRFIRGAFSTKGDSALSVARGNGKTALVAALACAVVDPDGPLHAWRAEVVCAASSFAQGKIIFEDLVCYLERLDHDLSDRKLWRRQDSQNVATLEHRPTGARVRCIGSDPKRAHGLRPTLALLDEPAQWEAAKRDAMIAAIRTGLGKRPGSRLIALGTRPADEGHWFSKMLDGAAAYAQTHAAGIEDPPFQVKTWRKANPSLSIMPDLLDEIRREAVLARLDPSMLASFRAYRLNQGVDDVVQATLLDAGTWARIEGEVERDGKPVWGLDLGQTEAMAAVSAYWPASGRLEALASFPSEPGLGERGLADGVGDLYRRMENKGELVTTGGEAVDIAALIRIAWERFGAPAAIAADLWKRGELRDILKRVRLPVCPFETRGQGFKDGAQDVRGFRRACLEGKVTPAASLLLTAAMSEARVVGDPAGNWKLAKSSQGGRRRRARDDAAAAAILAVALGTRRADKPAGRGFRHVLAG